MPPVYREAEAEEETAELGAMGRRRLAEEEEDCRAMVHRAVSAVWEAPRVAAPEVSLFHPAVWAVAMAAVVVVV